MHPFSFLPATVRWPALGAVLALTVLMAWYLADQAKPLRLDGPVPDGLLSCEFAWTSGRLQEITLAWGPELTASARRLLTADIAFAATYPVLLGLACAMVAELPGVPLAPFGLYLSWAVLFAFPAEVLENLALVHLLSRPAPEPAGETLVRAAGLLAGLKFVLAFAAIGYVLLAEIGLVAARLGIARA